MTHTVDWAPSNCLACDRQTDTNAFCSQVCHLAEHENFFITSVHSQQRKRSLIMSGSSQSSLISFQSDASGVLGGKPMSEEALKELREYASAFDLSRCQRRQRTP
jgi:hypothetical protein